MASSKATEAVSDFEKDLDNVGWLKTAEEKTKIPKTVILVTLGLTSFTTLYLTIGPGLLCNLVGFVYPAYASFKAIESETKEDDTQWLTYWVVYAIFNIFETFVDIVLFWFPFYYSIKFGFLIWLFLPNVRGAEYLYQHIILPIFMKQEKQIDSALDSFRKGLEDEDLDEEFEDDDDEDKKDK